MELKPCPFCGNKPYIGCHYLHRRKEKTMSILIKGIDMPKDGAFVEVLIWSNGHVTKTGDSYRAEDGRHYYQPCDWEYFSAIPVPPHGRLIDADALIEEWDNGLMDDAPTIIEAEGEYGSN